MRKKIFLLFLCFLFTPILINFAPLLFADENLTITTYYPSPYGSYNQLYVADKLGIGTTNPSSKLTIVGPLMAAGNNISMELYLPGTCAGLTHVGNFISIGSGSEHVLIGEDLPECNAGTDFVIRQMNPSDVEVETFRITENGYVGIGTSVPYSKIDIYDATAGRNNMMLYLRRNTLLEGWNTIVFHTGIYNSWDDQNTAGWVTGLYQGAGRTQDQFVIGGRDGSAMVNYGIHVQRTGNIGIGLVNPASYRNGANTLVVGNSNADGSISGSNGISIISGGAGTKSMLAFGYAASTADGTGSNRVKMWYDYDTDVFQIQNGAGLVTNPAGLSITASNNVGIGTTSPVTKLDIVASAGTIALRTTGVTNQWAGRFDGVDYGIYSQGTAYSAYFIGPGYLSTSAWVYGSDARMKENIRYMNDINAMHIIGMLKPATFGYINGAKKEAGFIAQDVQKVLPDLVMRDSKGMLGLKTTELIPYMVKGIQEQQKEIEELKARIVKLEKRG